MKLFKWGCKYEKDHPRIRRNKKKTLDKINIRKEREGTRIVVGMATCGITAVQDPC